MKQKIPKELKKELIMLQDMGLRDYEINYLMHMKTKKNARQKWVH